MRLSATRPRRSPALLVDGPPECSSCFSWCGNRFMRRLNRGAHSLDWPASLSHAERTSSPIDRGRGRCPRLRPGSRALPGSPRMTLGTGRTGSLAATLAAGSSQGRGGVERRSWLWQLPSRLPGPQAPFRRRTSDAAYWACGCDGGAASGGARSRAGSERRSGDTGARVDGCRFLGQPAGVPTRADDGAGRRHRSHSHRQRRGRGSRERWDRRGLGRHESPRGPDRRDQGRREGAEFPGAEEQRHGRWLDLRRVLHVPGPRRPHRRYGRSYRQRFWGRPQERRNSRRLGSERSSRDRRAGRSQRRRCDSHRRPGLHGRHQGGRHRRGVGQRSAGGSGRSVRRRFGVAGPGFRAGGQGRPYGRGVGDRRDRHGRTGGAQRRRVGDRVDECGWHGHGFRRQVRRDGRGLGRRRRVRCRSGVQRARECRFDHHRWRDGRRAPGRRHCR